MKTFAQIQAQLTDAINKKAILTHLVEHIEFNFLHAGKNVNAKVLLKPDKTAVPNEAYESVIADFMEEVKILNEVSTGLLATKMEDVQPVEKGK